MADSIISLHYSAEQLFHLAKNDYEPQKHTALWLEIRQQYPHGLTIRAGFSLDFKMPTIH